MLVILFLPGCASREISIFDHQGNVVGNCVAGFDWHFYGLQDSIDYILHKCAKESLAAGYTISDPTLQEKDFSLPAPPEGKKWNKKLAMEHFHKGAITETKLGYLLAELEFVYREKLKKAEIDLSSKKIDREQFEKIVFQARYDWLGE